MRANPIRTFAGFAALLALMLAATPAAAQEAVYPPGSRIGLVPPPGMVTSKVFKGFEDPDTNSAILLSIMPATAYAEMDKTLNAETLKTQGLVLEKREPMRLNTGKAFVVVAKQTDDKTHYRKWLLVAAADDFTALVSVQIPEQAKAYTDNVVRAALATLSVRASVPDDEQLGLLPFKVGDLAGFHIESVLPGRALMLVDPPKDPSQGTLDARLIVAATPGGPSEPTDRPNFARLIFNEIAGIRNVQITMSEPLRMNGQAGYQTMAQAKDTGTGINIMVVQWLRFGTGGFIQMIGMGRADIWTDVLARLRTVRDSIDPK